jgi:hypothetical protein
MANQPDTQKMTNSWLVNIDNNPIDTKRLKNYSTIQD